MKKEKAILVVSVGTTHARTREKTIDAIETDIAEMFPEYQVYRAWTGRKIIRILAQRDGVLVDTVTEALERMLKDGIREVIIQPTHLLDGVELEWMKREVQEYAGQFASVSLGRSLLGSEGDRDALAHIIGEEFSCGDPEAVLVLVGHGTACQANGWYAELNDRFRDLGYGRILVGINRDEEGIRQIGKALEALSATRVVVMPFMIVAGVHAQKDIAGGEPDSWRSRLTAAGYRVECRLKGLGEFPAVRRLFIEQVRRASGAD